MVCDMAAKVAYSFLIRNVGGDIFSLYLRLMAKKQPQTGTAQWNMRMPNNLKAQLVKEAKAARRATTSHIIYLLETHPERANVKCAA